MTKDEPKVPDQLVFNSQQLFQGKREIVIEHNQERYRLLITKSGKLILNK